MGKFVKFIVVAIVFTMIMKVALIANIAVSVIISTLLTKRIFSK